MTTDAKSADAKTADAKKDEAPPTPGKSSLVMGIVKLVIPALFAAGAAYGGTRAASAHGGVPGHEAPSAAQAEPKPPGPTLPLEPFLVTLFDVTRKPHPMKMSLAIEFAEGEGHGKEDPKSFMPRIRDTFLSHLRTITFEQATDPAHIEALRGELLERCRKVGAKSAEQILVTDFVVQ